MANRVSTIERDDDDGALFVKDGAPVKFCFHRSVTQGRDQIRRDIERHGGRVVRDERHANVLLVDEQEDLAFIRRRYYSSTELHRLSLYVETRGFVRACVRSGTYRHVGPVKQGMPGRAPGGVRRHVSFTEEDRDHLAYYLATRCPTRDGRTGNSAYKDLERLGQTDDPSWVWARRHTFHSWREHYKMNPAMMDARIDYYLKRLKGVGHHMGHDPRRHNHWNLRREEEGEGEGEGEDEDDEEQEQRQERERRDNERRERVPLAAAEARQGGGGIQEEEEIGNQDLQRVKRHVRDPCDVQQAKRARVSDATSDGRRASGVEAGRSESSSACERDSENEESQEIEGSDLFGDRAYGDESRFESDDSHEIEFPIPFSPRGSPAPEQDGIPLSTQATLIASPLAADKQPTPPPSPTPVKAVEREVPASQQTVPPSSQPTLVMTQERVLVQHARVRGASAQPGPSVSKETRTRGGVVAADAPYRNTRARSRSVDAQPMPEPQRAGQRKDQGGSGKGKAKSTEEALIPIEEDVRVEEGPMPVESYAKDAARVAVTNGLPTRETLEDEMAVEGLLEASEASLGVRDEEDGDEDGDGDGDDDGVDMPELPRFQDVEIDSEPTDSDDAETHGSLVRGIVREGSIGGSDPVAESDENQNEDQESDEDNADAERIERMARGSLRAVPVPAPVNVEPRITRSMAATQARTQTHQISPRRTRSRNQVRPTGFPSPGTKARAVVDRFQEEERNMPYAPPEGSRAAKVVRGRRKRGGNEVEVGK